MGRLASYAVGARYKAWCDRCRCTRACDVAEDWGEGFGPGNRSILLACRWCGYRFREFEGKVWINR